MKVKTYIIAVRGNNLVDKIIRKWQFGFPVTHIAYMLNSNFECPYVVEATLPKVRKGILDQHIGTEYDVYSIFVTPNQKKIIETFLDQQVGKGYDYLGLLGFPFRNYNIEQRNRWFCSELVFSAYLYAGIKLLINTKPAEVSPRLFLKSPLLTYEGTYKLSCIGG